MATKRKATDVSADASAGTAGGGGTHRMPPCTNNLTTALLMDTYQITMAYAYWKNGTHERPCAFDLLFRKNPFAGEFTVFAGLEESLRFISNFKFTEADLSYLRNDHVAKDMEPAVFDLLKNLNCDAIKVFAQMEGSVVFPRVPLLRVEGTSPYFPNPSIAFPKSKHTVEARLRPTVYSLTLHKSSGTQD